jgi:hypothetical protein
MVLAGQLGAGMPAAAASQAQLATLQSYLAANDLAGLVRYIDANPQLLKGSSPLTPVLTEFLLVFRGNARLVAFPPVTVNRAKQNLVEAVKSQIY